MARINIEDSLYLDIRFQTLSEKVGGTTMAIGAVVQTFILAQKYWRAGEMPIPTEIFKLLPFGEDILSCGLAEYVNEKEAVYVKGSREQFAWLMQKISAGRAGGVKSGISRNHSEKNEALLKRSSSGSKRREPSSSYSYSNTKNIEPSEQSSSDSNSLVEDLGSKKKTGRREPRPPAEKTPGAKMLDVYAAEIKKRYAGKEITRDAKVNTLFADMAEKLKDDAAGVVEYYVRSNDPFWSECAHSVGLLKSQLDTVHIKYNQAKSRIQQIKHDQERQEQVKKPQTPEEIKARGEALYKLQNGSQN